MSDYYKDPMDIIKRGHKDTLNESYVWWKVLGDDIDLYAIHPDWYGAGQVLFIREASDYGFIVTVFTDEIFEWHSSGFDTVWELTS